MGFLEAEASGASFVVWYFRSHIIPLRDRGPGLRQKNLRYIEKAVL